MCVNYDFSEGEKEASEKACGWNDKTALINQKINFKVLCLRRKGESKRDEVEKM